MPLSAPRALASLRRATSSVTSTSSTTVKCTAVRRSAASPRRSCAAHRGTADGSPRRSRAGARAGGAETGSAERGSRGPAERRRARSRPRRPCDARRRCDPNPAPGRGRCPARGRGVGRSGRRAPCHCLAAVGATAAIAGAAEPRRRAEPPRAQQQCGGPRAGGEVEDDVADRNGGALGRGDPGNRSARRSGHLDGRLVRHHLDDGLVLLDGGAFFDQPLGRSRPLRCPPRCRGSLNSIVAPPPPPLPGSGRGGRGRSAAGARAGRLRGWSGALRPEPHHRLGVQVTKITSPTGTTSPSWARGSRQIVPACGGGHLDRRLVGHDLDDGLVLVDGVADGRRATSRSHPRRCLRRCRAV